MKSFRIGTDRVITWHVFSEEGTNFNLEGSELTLVVSVNNTKFTVPAGQLFVEGGTLTWNFAGRDQKKTGPYSLTLIINNEQYGMVTIDKCNAFSLVGCSCQEGGTPDSDMEVTGVELASVLSAMGIYPVCGTTRNITYAELVSFRDAGSLIPGQQYRIIDYTTTTCQSSTRAAGNDFDIIVTALSERTLSEIAKAAIRDGLPYFEGQHLNAWQVWYCLDNHQSRFAWATPAGKGVIYRMIDEYGNDCPYDFKNILFYRRIENSDRFLYTFANIEGDCDASITGAAMNNRIMRGSSKTISWNIIAIGRFASYDIIIGESSSAYIDENCSAITIGNYSLDIYVGPYCQRQRIEDDCSEIVVEGQCEDGIIKSGCHSITIGPYSCRFNIGHGCSDVSIGRDSFNTDIGNSCYQIFLGQYCSRNRLGNSTDMIYLDNYCSGNRIDDNCANIGLGNSCNANIFHSNCYDIYLGSNCDGNIFCANINDLRINDESGSRSYCRNNYFGPGCSALYLTTSSVVGIAGRYLQNLFVAAQFFGDYEEIDVSTHINSGGPVHIARNSAGEVKVFCIADIIA